MTIDPTKPVILKKRIVTVNGNLYEARTQPYLPGELPADFVNDIYCTQEGIVVHNPIPTGMPERNLNPNAQPERLPSQLSKMDTANFVNINTDSAEKISSSLSGVGQKTAEKVVAERDAKGPFSDLNDLSTRVPLPLGREWQSFEKLVQF